MDETLTQVTYVYKLVETPVDPEDPEDPVTPEDPEDPVTPEDPEEPVTPEDPEEPVTPEEPETPRFPEKPRNPRTEPQAPKPGVVNPNTGDAGLLGSLGLGLSSLAMLIATRRKKKESDEE